MFQRSIARPPLSLCSSQPRLIGRLRIRFNSSQSGPNSSNQKKPESWTRFIAVRAAAVAGGYLVGKVYYYYNPKPDDSFQSYDLVSRDPISSSLSLFTLKPKDNATAKNAEEIRQAWKQGIWNFQFKQPQLQILRAYTPIPMSKAQDTDTKELQFLIRRDPRGEVSTYLHRLPPGTNIEMRGPNIEYPLSSDTKSVLFIAGGTGIAPALQVAHSMFMEPDSTLNDSQSSTTNLSDPKSLHILWANRQKEDTSTSNSPNPIIAYLNSLLSSHAQSFKITYFTDEEQTFITPDTLSAALVSINKNNNMLDPNQPTTKSEAPTTQIIISGPEGFITHLAGAKIWKDGREQQGPLGGILAKVLDEQRRKGLDVSQVKVWKV